MNLSNLFYELALEGGFSYNITTGEHNPTTGYMVSLQGHEKTYNSSDFVNNDIKAFVKNNAEHLSNEHRFVGGWADDELVYLDVSVNITNLKNAIYTGMTNNQLSIFDCANKLIINLPSPQRSGTMTQNRTYNEMKATQLAFNIQAI